MSREQARDEKNYYNVLADGKFHLTVPEGTDGAVLRTYETSDGTKGEKWELVFNALSGTIKDIEFYDGSFGKNLILNMEDEDGEFAISLSTSSNFGEDLLKKLLNIDMTKPVRFVPYSLIDDKTKKSKKGVTVYQGQDADGKFLTENENKVQSYFHDYNPDTKLTTIKNGYPKMPVAKKGKTISSDEWKMFFMQARLFMIEKIEEHFNLDNSAEADRKANAAFDGE